jgi:subtilisin-like proprotein convertase family protein
LNVSLNLGTTRFGNLSATLITPTGRRLKLFSHLAVDKTGEVTLVFDDSAASSITGTTPTGSGRFRPEEPLSNLRFDRLDVEAHG